MNQWKQGDFCKFVDETKSVYRARVVSIDGDKVLVQACINKKKKEKNDLCLIEGKLSQLVS